MSLWSCLLHFCIRIQFPSSANVVSMSSSLFFRSFRATPTRALARPTCKSLAAQSRRWLSTQTPAEPVSFEEPSRAGLFYHLVQQGVGARPAFAVSFLPQPPKSTTSPTVVGLLPVPKEGDEATFNDFVPNCESFQMAWTPTELLCSAIPNVVGVQYPRFFDKGAGRGS